MTARARSLGEESPARTHHFVAVIYKMWIMRCVSVPEEICRKLGLAARLPVVATIAGRPIRTTLVAASGGGYRLFLNGAMRKAAGVGVGDPVAVSLRVDTASREPIVPPDLARALRGAPKARRYFKDATTGTRLEVVRYIEQPKSAEARARRVRRCVETMIGRWEKKERRLRGNGKAARRASPRKSGGKPPHSKK